PLRPTREIEMRPPAVLVIDNLREPDYRRPRARRHRLRRGETPWANGHTPRPLWAWSHALGSNARRPGGIPSVIPGDPAGTRAAPTPRGGPRTMIRPAALNTKPSNNNAAPAPQMELRRGLVAMAPELFGRALRM